MPCPPPGNLPNPGIKPRSPTLQADSLPSGPPGKPIYIWGTPPNPPAWTSYLKPTTVFPVASLTSPFRCLISTYQLPCPSGNIPTPSPDLLYPTSFSISINGNLILPVSWVNILEVVLHLFFFNITHPVQQQSLTFPSKYMQLENQTSSHHFHFSVPPLISGFWQQPPR